MTNHIKFPINIAQAQGSYALELLIGSNNVPMKLLIDTGSSSLAFKAEHYVVADDQHLSTTQTAQCVTYGLGGWAGPVLQSTVTYSNGVDQFTVENASFSLVSNKKGKTFLGLDGILGLAYHHLNKGYNLSGFYKLKNEQTYPWTFSDTIKQSGLDSFKRFLNSYPEKDITPEFTAFEQQNISMNKFALSTHRSIVYVPNKNMSMEEMENEALNKGYFIIGDAEKEIDLYQGKSKNIKVVHDAYYNTNLLSVKVEGFEEFNAPPLDEAHINSFFSNAIIDSGSSYLMLQKQIYQYVMDSFKAIDPNFLIIIDAFKKTQQEKTAYSPTNLDLNKWPNLYFTFEGTDKNKETLCCQPDHYWQVDAMAPNQVFFTLLDQIPKWPNQSIIGLPIISSYLCIFDRSAGDEGVIKFANKLPLNKQIYSN